MRADDEVPSADTSSRGRSSARISPARIGIVDVVVDVGNEVGDPHDLSFDRARAQPRRHAHGGARFALRVLRDPVAHFPA